MSEHDFLHALKEDLPEGFAQELKAKLDALDEPVHNNRLDNHRTFWTVAAASMVTVLLGVVLLVSRIPQFQMLVIAPSAPVPSFTQHDTITSANIDQLQPFARLGNGMITGINITPDGEHLLISATTGLFLHDAHNLSAEPEQIYEGSIRYASDIDSNGYLYGIADSLYPQAEQIIISRWNGITGERTDILHLDEFGINALDGLEVKPDGSQMMLSLCREYRQFLDYGTVCKNKTYIWYDTQTGEQVYEISFDVGNVWSRYAMSDDWTYFAYMIDADDKETLSQPMIRLMNMETYAARNVVSFGAPYVVEPDVTMGGQLFTLSPDGQYMTTHSFATMQTISILLDVNRLWESEEPINPGSLNVEAILHRFSVSEFFIYQLYFAPDGQRAYATNSTQLIELDLTSEEGRLQPSRTADLNQGYSMYITTSPVLSPDGSILYIPYEGNIVLAYDTETLAKIDEMTYYQNDSDEQFEFIHDASQVVVYSGRYSGGIPDIWTINTDPPIHQTFLRDDVLTQTYSFAISPDGMTIAYQEDSVWHVENPVWIQHGEEIRQAIDLPPDANMRDLQFLDDGTLFGVIDNVGKPTIVRWSAADIADGNLLPNFFELELYNMSGIFQNVTGAQRYAIAPNGQWFALSPCVITEIVCNRSEFVIWNLETEERIRISDEVHLQQYGTMAFSPDSQLFAYGYCTEQFAFTIVNLQITCAAGSVNFYTLDSILGLIDTDMPQTLEPAFTITGFEQVPTHITFHPVQQDDGSWLVAITEWNTRTQLWRINPDGTAEVLRILDNVRQPVAFEPTGGLMFTMSDTAQTEVWGVPLP
jgi:WD40 repeat protein